MHSAYLALAIILAIDKIRFGIGLIPLLLVKIVAYMACLLHRVSLDTKEIAWLCAKIFTNGLFFVTIFIVLVIK